MSFCGSGGGGGGVIGVGGGGMKKEVGIRMSKSGVVLEVVEKKKIPSQTQPGWLGSGRNK